MGKTGSKVAFPGIYSTKYSPELLLIELSYGCDIIKKENHTERYCPVLCGSSQWQKSQNYFEEGTVCCPLRETNRSPLIS